MLHRDVLRLLFPSELSGVFDTDIEIEGGHLDLAQARAEQLLLEMFPDNTRMLLPDWERVCGLTPGADDPQQLRRDRVIRKLREIGGLSIPYFTLLAQSMGYTITVEELYPFMAGWGRAGDPLYVEESWWIWRVNISGQALYYLTAGQSAAGERILWWPPVTELENILNDLKPAHTYIVFDYS